MLATAAAPALAASSVPAASTPAPSTSTAPTAAAGTQADPLDSPRWEDMRKSFFADATVVFADRDVRRRRDGLQRRMGRAAGRLGRHDRYVTTDAEATTETLVEPGTMLPVEVKIGRAHV